MYCKARSKWDVGGRGYGKRLETKDKVVCTQAAGKVENPYLQNTLTDIKKNEYVSLAAAKINVDRSRTSAKRSAESRFLFIINAVRPVRII